MPYLNLNYMHSSDLSTGRNIFIQFVFVSKDNQIVEEEHNANEVESDIEQIDDEDIYEDDFESTGIIYWSIVYIFCLQHFPTTCAHCNLTSM